MPSISVIIPTWNEEHWLPRALRSLATEHQVAELIVADNNSVDRTREIAQSFDCFLVEGGLPGKARNAGARIATNPILMFVDADVTFPRGGATTILEAFDDSRIVAVHGRLSPISTDLSAHLGYILLDIYLSVLSLLGFSQGIGSFIAIRRESFHALGGFDERILVGEDVDIIRRLSRTGTVKYARHLKIPVSARRLNIEVPLWFGLKCLFWGILRVLGSRRSYINYRWQTYPSYIAQQEASLLDND